MASQLSQCYGAGTGCGWCRPFLEKMLRESDPNNVELPDSATYAKQRKAYRDEFDLARINSSAVLALATVVDSCGKTVASAKTADAQAALSIIGKRYSQQTSYCIICNFP